MAVQSPQLSQPKQEYLRKLERYAGSRQGRSYEDKVKKLVLTAISVGVPQANIVEALKISSATLHRWQKALSPKIKKTDRTKKAAKRPSPSNNVDVRTLSVVPSSAGPSNRLNSSKTCIEIGIGDISIKIFGGAK